MVVMYFVVDTNLTYYNYYYQCYYYISLLTLHMSTLDGQIVGADGIPWWSPIQVLVTN